MTRKTTQAAPAVSASREDLPSKLAALIDDCLAIDPELRPSSVRLFLSRLEEGLRQLPRDTPQPVAAAAAAAVAEPAASAATRKPAWLVPAIGALLVGGAVAAFFAMRGPSSPSPDAAATGAGAPTASMDLSDTSTGSGAASETSGDVGPTTVTGATGATGATTATGATGATTATGATGATGATAATGAAAATGATGSSGAKASTGTQADPSAPAYRSAACQRQRKQAKDSASSGAWADVLRRTKKRECWARTAERRALEVQAYKELQRFEECAKAGKGLSDPAIKRTVTLCEKRAAQP